MTAFNVGQFTKSCTGIIVISGALAVNATAQYGGTGTGTGTTTGTTGTGTTTTGTTTTGGDVAGTAAAASSTNSLNRNYHIGFDRPEAWGLKYFASATMLSGLVPVEPAEGHRIGAITVGLELGWLPTLDAGQTRIGFDGHAPQDLNKAPLFARPIVRIGLPWKLSAIVAAPPPFRTFGITPRLLAFGVERPIFEGEQWTISWRGYGQVGSIKGAFTCPTSVLAFVPGTPGNATRCTGESADVASLRYAGNELEASYRIPGMPKLVPHIAAGGNFIDGAFQVHAPVGAGLDETRLWTRGGTFSGTAGATYAISKRVAFTVDGFYTPLFVKRSAATPDTNDGLFNVRALVSYSFQ